MVSWNNKNYPIFEVRYVTIINLAMYYDLQITVNIVYISKFN